LLDGFSGPRLGVMVPLVVAEVTRGTGRSICSSIVGTAVGIGAAISTTFAIY